MTEEGGVELVDCAGRSQRDSWMGLPQHDRGITLEDLYIYICAYTYIYIYMCVHIKIVCTSNVITLVVKIRWIAVSSILMKTAIVSCYWHCSSFYDLAQY